MRGQALVALALSGDAEESLTREVLRRADLMANPFDTGGWYWNGVAMWPDGRDDHPRQKLIRARAGILSIWDSACVTGFMIVAPGGDLVAECYWVRRAGWSLSLTNEWRAGPLAGEEEWERLARRLPSELFVRWADWWPSDEELAAADEEWRRMGEEELRKAKAEMAKRSIPVPPDLPADPHRAVEVIQGIIAEWEEARRREAERRRQQEEERQFHEELRSKGWFYGRLRGRSLPEDFEVLSVRSHGSRTDPVILAVGPGLTTDGLAEVVGYLGGGEVEISPSGRVIIRANKPGMVIGRGGRVVRALQAATGRRIRVK